MDRHQYLDNVKTVVIKIGTSSITDGTTSVSAKFMDSIARQVKELKEKGLQVLLVSSGAVGIGLCAMNAKPKPKEVPIRQAAAAVGQGILMQKWNESFEKVDIVISQVLLTYDFYSDRENFLNIRNAIQTLLEYGVVPIFNENDVVSTREIGPVFGDNDTLSALIASKMDADLLIILSDVEGLYDKNPQSHKDAKIISSVEDVKSVRSMAGDAGSKFGTGGMKTKMDAADICSEAGCQMIIIGNKVKDGLVRAVDAEEIGTIFIAGEKERGKLRWIKSAHSKGKIIVDKGAADILRKGNVSLLAVGIKSVEGKFERGDVVDIVYNDETIAKGLPDYNADDTAKICGVQSKDIESILGHKTYNDVIRSENIVLM